MMVLLVFLGLPQIVILHDNATSHGRSGKETNPKGQHLNILGSRIFRQTKKAYISFVSPKILATARNSRYTSKSYNAIRLALER
jgi:hypothetical protein